MVIGSLPSAGFAASSPDMVIGLTLSFPVNRYNARDMVGVSELMFQNRQCCRDKVFQSQPRPLLLRDSFFFPARPRTDFRSAARACPIGRNQIKIWKNRKELKMNSRHHIIPTISNISFVVAIRKLKRRNDWFQTFMSI